MGLVDRSPSAAAARPRRATRSTWRSIGNSGWPKQNSSTIEAVFLPMPSIARQPVAGLERRHVAEELEGVVAALLADRPQRRLEARRLLVGQAAGPDDVVSSSIGANSTAAQSGGAPSGRPTPPQPLPGMVLLRRQAARIGAPERLERLLGVRCRRCSG